MWRKSLEYLQQWPRYMPGPGIESQKENTFVKTRKNWFWFASPLAKMNDVILFE